MILGTLQSLEHRRMDAASGASDTVRCLDRSPRELDALGFSQSHSTKNHRYESTTDPEGK